MTTQDGKKIDEAFEYCANITNQHYENFPVASLFLPKEKRPYIQSIYAFARIADDIADDEKVDSQTRLQKLEEWERMLKDCYEGEPNHPVFVALKETVTRLSIPIEPLANLLKAFKMDIEKNHFINFDEVLHYCEFSANPVGRLILMIFGYKNEEYFKHSDSICTALQLTNFYQDVAIDLEKNRIYIPEDEIVSTNYSEDKLYKKQYDKEFVNLMKIQVDRARELFYAGSGLPSLVDRDLQLELKLIWFGGMQVLKKIERKKFEVFSKRIKLHLLDKVLIFLRGLFYNDLTKYRRRSIWDLT
ncbi:MAG: squalene synthase HpnC [Bacteroidota bacterium]|nr:squalene synthase HpnC [Bacteroidota bacterium]